jgi:hypothetical protein
MSAYYVGNKQISAIANAMHEIAPQLDKEVAEKIPKDPEVFARALAEMNVEALKERYPEMWNEMVEEFEYSTDKLSTKTNEEAQLYKSISCFLYQCSEGKVPSSDLYCLVERLHNRLAQRIASRWADAMGARWE